MLDYFINLIGRLGQWAYLVIFLVAMLESVPFMGLIFPGESLLLVTGFISAQGLLDLDVLILTVAIAAALGSSISYEMGQRMGRPALTRYGSHFGLTDARIDKTVAIFVRHGGKAVFLSRFVGLARAIVPFLAGSSRMPYRQFLPYYILGAGLWSTAVILFGYFLGATWRTAERWIGRASAIFGGIFVFFLALVWLYRLAARHEAGIKLEWMRFPTRPRIAALRLRFAPQIAFIHARLSPGSYLGLNLTLGALVLIGASWLFGGIAEDVATGDPLTVIDVRVANWFHGHATPVLTQCMLFITNLHGPAAISVLMALATLYLAWKRDWYWLICLLVTVPSGMLLNVLMKFAFHRARPSFDHPLLVVSSYSFPSGHAAGTTLYYGVLAAMMVTKISTWRSRVIIVLTTMALIFVVSLSRVYLGVHYLSDVLGGFAEAMAWLALCLVGIHTYWQHRVARRV